VIVQTTELDRDGIKCRWTLVGSKMWGRPSERQEGVWVLLLPEPTVNCNHEQEQGKRQRTCKDQISNYRHLSLFTFSENSIGRARTLFINLSKRSENWPLFRQSFVEPFHQVANVQIFSICNHLPARCGVDENSAATRKQSRG